MEESKKDAWTGLMAKIFEFDEAKGCVKETSNPAKIDYSKMSIREIQVSMEARRSVTVMLE